MCRICAPVASRHARVREARMAAHLDEWAAAGLIPAVTLWNRSNPMSDRAQCKAYRVDFVFERAEGVVLLEYDEAMHSDRDRRCELVRQGEVALGYGGRPVHWIRFNPDAFEVGGQTRRTSTKERMDFVLGALRSALAVADYAHLITVDYVCYTKERGDAASDLVQTFKFGTIEDYCVWAESV
jgi:hypothetical protein